MESLRFIKELNDLDYQRIYTYFKVRKRQLSMEEIIEVSTALKSCDTHEELCLRYLYGVLPLEDVQSHSPWYFLTYIRCILKSICEVSWKGDITKELFFSYILPCRINDEELSPQYAYGFFQNEILDRIKELNTYDAIQWVNAWCGSKVKYRSTDIHTSSPWVTYRRGYGRCGEESTLVVSILRVLGIPARQIYVPRWSHCDDNHAWVEAYSQGQWTYFGACEPLPSLNQGWFTKSASRALMIHSYAYSLFPIDEAIECKNHHYRIPRTDFYGVTRDFSLHLFDSEHNPLSEFGFKVCILNEGEMFILLNGRTNREGHANFTLGCGDFTLMVEKEDSLYTFNIDSRETEDFNLICSESNNISNGRQMIQKAPQGSQVNHTRYESILPEFSQVDIPNTILIPDQLQVLNTFYNEHNLLHIRDILTKAQGNTLSIHDFLLAVKEEMALAFLDTLSEKQLTTLLTEQLCKAYKIYCNHVGVELVIHTQSELEYLREYTLISIPSLKTVEGLPPLEKGENRLDLVPGKYVLYVTRRTPAGDVHSNSYFFNTSRDAMVHIEFPQLSYEDYMVSIPVEGYRQKESSEPMVLIFLNKGEPSDHVLQELVNKPSNSVLLQKDIHLIAHADFYNLLEQYKGLPSCLHRRTELEGEKESISRSLYLEPEQYPVIALVNQDKVVYKSADYNVNHMDLLESILGLL